jgi:hypothetical protein
MASSEWRMGTPNGPFAIRHSLLETPAGTKPAGAGDALGRSAMMPDCPLSSEQGLENAQNDKGWLLARVGIDLGSASRSLGVGAAS